MTAEQHAKRLWNAAWDSGQPEAFLSLATEEFRAYGEEVWRKMRNECQAPEFAAGCGADRCAFSVCPLMAEEPPTQEAK